MFWLEPLVEVQTSKGRVAYGPVQVSDIDSLLDAGLLEGGKHKLGLGLTEQIPYLAKQERLTFARMGIIDPLSMSDYEAHSGWKGLRRALTLDGDSIVQENVDSGLRVRGGLHFLQVSSGGR
jgi:formate dehydrogenase iron-sulfur subunit